MNKNYLLAIFALFASGCVSLGGNIDLKQYQDAALPKPAKPIPKSQLVSKPTSVYVKVSDKSVKDGLNSKYQAMFLGLLVQDAVDTLKENGIKFTNTSLQAKKLASGEALIKPLQSVGGEVKASTFMLEFELADAAVETKTSKDWKLLKDSPQTYTCKYLGEVEVIARVYKMPGAKVVAKLEMKDTENSDFSTEDSKECKTKVGQHIEKLLPVMAEDVVNKNITDIANQLAATGYVLAKRSGKDGTVFQISLGENHGLEKGDEIKVFSRKQIEAKHAKDEKVKAIASGTVSNLIDKDTAWVTISKSNGAEEVHYADYVRVVRERGVMSYLKYLFD